MRRQALWAVLLWVAWIALAQAEDTYQRVSVVEPYLELHTGPGAGFPIFHVVERGESLEILKRRTYWFKVRTADGKEGWVIQDQIELTLSETGQPNIFIGATREDFAARDYEIALMGGYFDGAAVLSMNAGWGFTDTYTAELTLSQVLGEFSSSWLVNVGLVANPFSDWRVSPFFGIGVGGISTEPRVTLVQAEDENSGFASATLGIRTYLTRRFVLRADYTHYVVFEDDDNNEEHEEWKAGIAFFF